jgi:hypothetical protein
LSFTARNPQFLSETTTRDKSEFGT